jgi:hypothetical protein
VARLPSRWSVMMALRIGGSPPIPHQTINLPACKAFISGLASHFWFSGPVESKYGIKFSVEVNAPFSRCPPPPPWSLFRTSPLSSSAIISNCHFTFIDLFLQVHLHHIFMLMSFAIVLGQFSYIYNLGETGCYNSLPLKKEHRPRCS